MKNNPVEDRNEESIEELNEESKGGRTQIMLRVSIEERTHFAECGERAGFSSVSKFIIAAMNRYGDVLAKAIFDEDRETEELRNRHRDEFRRKLQSSESS